MIDRTAFLVVDEFERRLCEYTGAPFCVTTDSCTNALYLCFVRWIRRFPNEKKLNCPAFTYVGVVRAMLNAGLEPQFHTNRWWECGQYSFFPAEIIDSARLLKRGMYKHGTWTCLSFQATKHLPIGRGGAILCTKQEDADWFRRARFDGRDQNVSLFDQEEFGFGVHCYLPPDAAARGLWLMGALKGDNKPLPAEYPDLSKVKFA